MSSFPGPEFASKLKPFASVPMDIDVELHRTTMTVRELLALKEGSIISAGPRLSADLTIRVGGAAIAKGELAANAKKQAIRLTSFCRTERV